MSAGPPGLSSVLQTASANSYSRLPPDARELSEGKGHEGSSGEEQELSLCHEDSSRSKKPVLYINSPPESTALSSRPIKSPFGISPYTSSKNAASSRHGGRPSLGAFRPMNTLGGNAFAAGKTVAVHSNTTSASLLGRTTRIARLSHGGEGDDGSEVPGLESARKRQKVTQQEVRSILDTSHRLRSSKTERGGISAAAFGSHRTTNREANKQGTSFGTSEEYRNLERTVSTQGYDPQMAREQVDTPLTEVMAHPPSYRGTGRTRSSKPSELERSAVQREVDLQERVRNGPHTRAGNDLNATGTKMRRFDMQDASSSDELSTDAQRTFKGSTQRTTRWEAKVAAARKDDRNVETHVDGVLSSNIKPTSFLGPKSTKRNEPTARKMSIDQHASSTKYPLEYASNLAHDPGQNQLYLVLDEQGRHFFILNQGGERHSEPLRRIACNSIHTINFSPGTSKIRLYASRDHGAGQQDPHILMEFTDAQHRAELIRFLQQRSATKIVQMDASKLDQIFEKHKSVCQEHVRRRPLHGPEPDDVALIQANRSKTRKDADVNIRLSQRLTSKLRPERQDGAQRSSHTEQQHDAISPQPRDIAFPSHDATTGLDRKISMLDWEKPYRTRSSVSTRRERASDQAPFDLDALVEKDRRSRKPEVMGKPWKKPLVYPSEGKKKTVVEYSDLERLDDGEFLNDNLIAFYLRYLECELEKQSPNQAKRVYWFNTYFFASLTNVSKSGQINYEAVRKWTRAVDLLSYDYAIVPINESAHWYLAIMCNLPQLNRVCIPLDDEDPSPLPKRPHGEDVAAGILDVDASTPRPVSFSPHPLHPGSPTKLADSMPIDITMGEASPVVMVAESPVGTVDDEMPDAEDGIEDAKTAADARPDSDFQSLEDLVREDSPKVISPRGKSGRRKKQVRLRSYSPDTPAILTLDSLGISHPNTTKILKDYLREEASTRRQMAIERSDIQGVSVKQIPQQQNFCDCGVYLLGYVAEFTRNPREFISKSLVRGFDESADWKSLQASRLREKIFNLVQDLHRQQHNTKPKTSTGIGPQSEPTAAASMEAMNATQRDGNGLPEHVGGSRHPSMEKERPQPSVQASGGADQEVNDREPSPGHERPAVMPAVAPADTESVDDASSPIDLISTIPQEAIPNSQSTVTADVGF